MINTQHKNYMKTLPFTCKRVKRPIALNYPSTNLSLRQRGRQVCMCLNHALHFGTVYAVAMFLSAAANRTPFPILVQRNILLLCSQRAIHLLLNLACWVVQYRPLQQLLISTIFKNGEQTYSKNGCHLIILLYASKLALLASFMCLQFKIIFGSYRGQ